MKVEEKPHYYGHRSRLKEKFKKAGIDNLKDYEILELALIFAIPRKDTKPLAKELIKKFGTLKQVIDAEIAELLEVKGISEHTCLFIKYLKSFASLYSYLELKTKDPLSSPEAVVKYLISVLSAEKIEKFYALFFNSGNKVISCQTIEYGTVNKSVVFPSKIAKAALKLNAASVIVAHNHPGGTLRPSQNDIDATSAVKAALASIEISLLDHIIISGSKYFSFKEYNLI